MDDSGDLPETAAEELRDLFTRLGRQSDYDVLGGMCAAAAVWGAEIAPEDIAAWLWGASPPSPWTEDDAAHLGDLVAEYWNETEDRLEIAADEDTPETIPHFVDQFRETDPDFRECARRWCWGFMRVVEAWPEAWPGVLERADLKPHFVTLAAIAGEGAGSTGAESIPADTLPRRIGAAVLALRAVLSPQRNDSTAGEV